MKKSKNFLKSLLKAIFVHFILIIVFAFSYNAISAINWQSHKPDGKGASEIERQTNPYICKHTNHWHSRSRYYHCNLSKVVDEVIFHSIAFIFLFLFLGMVFHPIIILINITLISLLTSSFYHEHSWMSHLAKKFKRKKSI